MYGLNARTHRRDALARMTEHFRALGYNPDVCERPLGRLSGACE